MLTSNRSYDMDFYRRSNQTMNLMLRNHSLTDGYGSPAYSPNRDTPGPEGENKHPGTHRKRVPVACERCRKRKIKCSGDQGDGSGCDNCKSAGHDGCQFLRVHSRPMQPYTQPTQNFHRWHTHHYHPYSRPAHLHAVQQAQQIQQAQQAREYAQQSASPYDTWQHGIDYTSLPAATTANMAWAANGYPTPYQICDSENTSPYTAEPPSYMLPDPGHGPSTDVNYLASLPRSQHSSIWMDSMNNAAISQQHVQHASTAYPLTPADSLPSCSLLSQPTRVSLSYEKQLPTPLSQTLPSQGQETPPLSAASHRTSQTWMTDTGSNLSAVSSRTSYGGSQDMSVVAHAFNAGNDQAAYSYQSGEINSHNDGALSSLPVLSREDTHLSSTQQASQAMATSNMQAGSLRSRASYERLLLTRAKIHKQRRAAQMSTRRSHNMYPPRLVTTFEASHPPPSWSLSPNTASSSRQNSTTGQVVVQPEMDNGEDYNDENSQAVEQQSDSVY